MEKAAGQYTKLTAAFLSKGFPTGNPWFYNLVVTKIS